MGRGRGSLATPQKQNSMQNATGLIDRSASPAYCLPKENDCPIMSLGAIFRQDRLKPVDQFLALLIYSALCDRYISGIANPASQLLLMFSFYTVSLGVSSL